MKQMIARGQIWLLWNKLVGQKYYLLISLLIEIYLCFVIHIYE